jgi:UDP-glucose 4-epimerase
MSKDGMSKFLVTGGCGFIGSHLCAALIAAGHAVRVLDDLSTGVLANLAPGAELIRGDVADAGLVATALQGVAGCFHLAAVASVARGVEDWLGTHRTNLTGTITILDAVRRLPARRLPAPRVPVVYASSAAVYGECRTLPIAEAAEKRPLSAYGADKYGCELHARVATEVHGIPTTGLRFFNVYGPRQEPNSPYSGVISIFAARLRRGAPIDVFGDGRQRRDFIAVGDVVAALIQAMARRLPGAPVFNVCTGVPTSVLDLAGTVASLCGVHPEIRFRPRRSAEISDSWGSPTAARAALGLGEPVALRAGLAEVLAWLAAAEGQGAGMAAVDGTTAAESAFDLSHAARSEEDE